MPDNVTLPGVGEVVSTDETAQGQVQRVKLAMSADGSSAHIPADADGMLVNLGVNNDVTVPGVSATGSLGALNAAVALSLNGASGFAVDLRGTFVATVTFQGTVDGTNWITLAVLPVGAGVNVATVTTATAPGAWSGSANGLQQVRATATAYTSGSVTVTLRAMQAVGVVATLPAGQTTQAVSGTVTANVTGYPAAAASADALANPTVTKLDALGLAFNGATWDRVRNNTNVTVDTSAARTTTGTGTTATNHNARGAYVFVNVTAASGATPTLVVRLQWSPDGGTTWVDLDTTNAQTATLTGISTAVLRVYPGIATTANASLNAVLPRTWRLAWTIGGTTPSFTFATFASYVL